jgi:hypothetical protein
VLNGPELDSIDNWAVNFAWAPSKDFQLMATYTHWEADIAKDDVLNENFATEYNSQFEAADQRIFRDAVLDQRDLEIDWYEVGLVKTIPLGSKHWEAFIGIGIGITNSVADVTWTGAEMRTGGPAVPVPSLHIEDNNAFFTSVGEASVGFPFPGSASAPPPRWSPSAASSTRTSTRSKSTATSRSVSASSSRIG